MIAFLYNNLLIISFSRIHQQLQVIIDSTNVYAPVLEIHHLMAFDNLLEDVCNDATVFFAMIQMLFNFK
jgi:hypothetical protein